MVPGESDQARKAEAHDQGPQETAVFLSASEVANSLSLLVVGLLAAAVTLFCAIDWNNPLFDGLSSYQKIINALFTAVNTRHSGENSIDCSSISPAVLVLFIAMMLVLGTTLSY